MGGELFLAQQDDPATPGAENPFDSMLAVYLVIKTEKLGIVVKQAGKVEADPSTGRLTTTFENLPQLPFEHLELHLREGPRAPLVTPRLRHLHHRGPDDALGRPGRSHHRPASRSPGIGGGPCPPRAAAVPPGFTAGTVNNNAGSYSPFNLRLTRRDGDRR